MAGTHDIGAAQIAHSLAARELREQTLQVSSGIQSWVPRKPVASTYISADSALEAFGLTWRTLANEGLRLATSSLSAAPCRTLQRKAPPGARISSAKSSAASTSPMMRK